MRPSEVLDEPWLWAQRVHGNWPPLTERSGKWLVFVGAGYVDDAWELICAATERGRLGPCSKVATAMPSEYAPSPAVKVICVYTYDWADEADVSRVREELRTGCAVKRAIAYKTDEDTLDGNYGAGVAKYRA